MAGRPTKEPGQKMDVPLRIMLTAEQSRVIKEATDGQDVSAWARAILLDAAKRMPSSRLIVNAAQTTEKHRFQEMLHDLCRGVPQPLRPRGRPGRYPVLFADAIFAITFKVYSKISTRRFACDLKDAYERGHISRPVHYSSICAYLENHHLTPILHGLIERSALPLQAIETNFVVDSSGFSANQFENWYDEKYGKMRKKRQWVKVHISTGVKTNIITSVRILGRDVVDLPLGFKIEEVSADKAYSSLENFDYHKRSNVESTFSMVKAKFGDSVLSRCPVAMTNEVLCKLLGHNLCCLISAQHG
jgi:hypothetical protein